MKSQKLSALELFITHDACILGWWCVRGSSPQPTFDSETSLGGEPKLSEDGSSPARACQLRFLRGVLCHRPF